VLCSHMQDDPDFKTLPFNPKLEFWMWTIRNRDVVIVCNHKIMTAPNTDLINTKNDI